MIYLNRETIGILCLEIMATTNCMYKPEIADFFPLSSVSEKNFKVIC